ncbi:hypothetical protein VPH35_109171 [Triticum aestivum]|uniref:F-box domain-containing protein n=1 Tax=Triticum turgidum subsp. durum TaxID=4567 RepID=A0A9R0YFJ5_TRITD|nr:F-box protein SKIP19-like [Triticum aestivum]VAI54490.1 unnamed protein product [Triticum turgidum subsp. durum]
MPSSPPAAAPRSRRYSKRRARAFHVTVFKYTPVPLPERDWAELHPDLISRIFRRLDQAELLLGGVTGVCRSWRRVAREELELWRRIDLSGGLWYAPGSYPPMFNLETRSMVRKALRLSAGQCETLVCEHVDDDTLLFLAERAHSLKSLHLIVTLISDKGFAKAIKMLPLLEELEITLLSKTYTLDVVEIAARACPLLKHFRLVTGRYYENGNKVAFAVARMRKLRSLHLVGFVLDKEGLTAILNNCHDLKYLNMRDCGSPMDYNLRARFSWITFDEHEYWSDYYNDTHYAYYRFKPTLCDCCDHVPSSKYDDDDYEAYHYNLGDGDGDDVDNADLDKHEKILDIKSMRRYLSR